MNLLTIFVDLLVVDNEENTNLKVFGPEDSLSEENICLNGLKDLLFLTSVRDKVLSKSKAISISSYDTLASVSSKSGISCGRQLGFFG